MEIAIKKILGKLEAPEGLSSILKEEGFSALPIQPYHGELSGTLPMIHKDPFDRLLVAQALADGLELVTKPVVKHRPIGR
nr:type II toxin-antitoxin system VapC family toxin [Endozoicomonas sp. ONNA2]